MLEDGGAPVVRPQMLLIDNEIQESAGVGGIFREALLTKGAGLVLHKRISEREERDR